MATNPAPFPTPGESPYGDKVQDYIDAGDAAVEAAAEADATTKSNAAKAEAKADAAADATSKVSAHEAKTDPHPQYARLDTANTFTAGGHSIEGFGRFLDVTNTNADSGSRRWSMFVQGGNGALRFSPSDDTGAPIGTNFEFRRDGRWSRGGVSEITGTGNPNGTVSAPVGSVFRNTEAGGYNGARVWRKDAGTGTSGWVVESGDTGWRLIGSELINGWTSPTGWTGVRIRRTNDRVEINVRGLDGTAATSTQIYKILTSGFTPQAADGGLVAFGTNTLRVLRCDTAGNIQVLDQAGESGIGASLSTSWSVTSTWPDTLPGTPA